VERAFVLMENLKTHVGTAVVIIFVSTDDLKIFAKHVMEKTYVSIIK
jgi:hypothetical protein